MTGVDLGPNSLELFNQATKGQLDPGKLHLYKDENKWKLLQSDEVPEGSHISGEQLFSLIKAAAEGQTERPNELQGVMEEKDFKRITSDKRFQLLCRLIPVEGGDAGKVREAKAARKRRSAVWKRTIGYAKTVGKGFKEMEKAGLGDVLLVRGRIPHMITS